MYERNAKNASLQEAVAEAGTLNTTVTAPIHDTMPNVQKIWLRDIYDMRVIDSSNYPDSVAVTLELGRGEYAEDVVYMTKATKRRLFKTYTGYVLDLAFKIDDGVTVVEVVGDRDLPLGDAEADDVDTNA